MWSVQLGVSKETCAGIPTVWKARCQLTDRHDFAATVLDIDRHDGHTEPSYLDGHLQARPAGKRPSAGCSRSGDGKCHRATRPRRDRHEERYSLSAHRESEDQVLYHRTPMNRA